MKQIIKYLLIIFLLVNSGIAQEIIPLSNSEEFDNLKKEKAGKVFLVNLWATWCGPCKKEFPDLVKLHNNFKENNFEVIFVSLDEKEEINTTVKNFLKTHNVDFTSYYYNFPTPDEFLNYIGNNWDGAIPATFIYDREGNLASNFIGKKDYEQFRNLIEPLL